MVRARPGAQSVFERVQDHVDLAIAVGVHAGLQAGLVYGQDRPVELLLRPRGLFGVQ